LYFVSFTFVSFTFVSFTFVSFAFYGPNPQFQILFASLIKFSIAVVYEDRMCPKNGNECWEHPKE